MKNSLKRKLLILIIFAFTIMLITSISYANETDTSPSIQLQMTNPTESTLSNQEIHIIIANSNELVSKTRRITKEIKENDDNLKEISFQLQTKKDSESWKTSKVGDFGSLQTDNESIDVKISDTSQIDLSIHTLYVKFRYAWISEKGIIYYDEWSEVAAIGKDSKIASVPDNLSDFPEFSEVKFDFNNSETPTVQITLKKFSDTIANYSVNPSGSLMINIMLSEKDSEYRNIRFQPVSGIESDRILQCSLLNEIGEYESGNVKIKARYEWYTGGTSYYGIKTPDLVSPWSDEISGSIELWSKASKWALNELNSAKSEKIIPACLMGHDMTKYITRSEFISTAVKLYEMKTKKTVDIPQESPFKDSDSPDVLKAYKLGIINGISENIFAPDNNITREQASVIMTRLYKLLKFKNWTLENDSEFKLEYNTPEKFSDDNLISTYAKDSVYFMESMGIIKGTGNNKFNPNNSTSANKKSKIGNTTREQAVIISLRMNESF